MKFNKILYLQISLADAWAADMDPEGAIKDLSLYKRLGERLLKEEGPEHFAHIMVTHNPFLLSRMIDKQLEYHEIQMGLQEAFQAIDETWEIPGF